MKNLIKETKISSKQLCRRMTKYNHLINKENKYVYKALIAELQQNGIPTEKNLKVDNLLENFSEILYMQIEGNKKVDDIVRFVISDIIKSKVPISYIEKFIYEFREIVIPHLQKEFSDQYYSFFNAQKIVDAAFRHLWLKAIDEYYHQNTEKLEESEKKYRTIFENVSDEIVYTDKYGKIIDINKSFTEIFGYDRDKVKGKHFTKIGVFRLRDIPMMIKIFRKIIAKKPVDGVEIKAKTKSGKLLTIEASAKPVVKGGKIEGMVGIIRNVTERKKAEEALRKAKAYSESIINSMTDGLWVIDMHGRTINVNPAAVKMYGYKNKNDLLQKSPADVTPKRDLKRTMNLIKNAFAGKSATDELHFIRKSGKEIPANITAIPIRNEEGKIIGGFAVIRDISERKKAEKILKESEEKFRKIFENASDGILIADVKTKNFVGANRRICKMLGYTEKELKKLDVSKIHPKKDLPKVIKAFKLQAQRKLTVAKRLPLLKKNNKVIYADISSAPFEMNGKKYLIGFFRKS